MGTKSAKIEGLLVELGVEGREISPYYEGYFACFNRQLFYEAHEVLEELWQPARLQGDGNFYKGLIQLAGAFVHLQKGKREPSIRLFRMARANLEGYPAVHHRLKMAGVMDLIEGWVARLEHAEPTLPELVPKLGLEPA